MKAPALMLAAGTLLLGACVSASTSVPAQRPTSAQTGSSVVRVPQVMAAQGLEGIIGASPRALLQRFGTPRIDLAEGDARKLQFAGASCVLDIFVYPISAAAEPTATHVMARLRAGGAPADARACIREVERER